MSWHQGPRQPRRSQLQLTPTALARLRTAGTLLVLLVLLVVGVAVGWSKLRQPYPSLYQASSGICTDLNLTKGDKLKPSQVIVSVINSGNRDGLAATTLSDLVSDGFSRGSLDNAPKGVNAGDVAIWTTDATSPAVRLVRSYLGKDVVIRNRDAGSPGVNVVVGDKFAGVVKGRTSLRSRGDAVVCAP